MKATAACAEASDASLRDAIQAGRAIGVFWDNMTMARKVGEETTLNRHEFVNWTARGAWEIRPPIKCPLPWEVQYDWEERENLGSTTSYIAEIMSSNDDDIDMVGAENSNKEVLPCLDPKILFKDAVYKDLDLCEILRLEQMEKYYEEVSKGLIAEVLGEYCTTFQKIDRKNIPKVPEICCLPKEASQIWTLPVLEVDEATLDGNAQLLEEFIHSLGIPLSAMCGRTTLVAGDLMSVNRIDGVIRLRKRDLPERNMEWATTINRHLHTGMTSASAVLDASAGRADGRDPASLRRIATMLGRNKVFDSKSIKDYTALHRLIMHCWKAHILVAAIELVREGTDCDSVEALDTWLSEEPSRCEELISRVVAKFMCPLQVKNIRREAMEAAQTQFEKLKNTVKESVELRKKNGEVMSGSGRGIGRRRGFPYSGIGREERGRGGYEGSKSTRRGRGRAAREVARGKRGGVSLDAEDYDSVSAVTKAKDALLRALSRNSRDLAYENFILFLQHSTMYVDFYSAVRKGDSGRVERSLDLHSVFFHGTGRWNYAKELLDLQIDRRLLWTNEMRGYWLSNTLLNLSGTSDKFMGIDEANEYVVRELKDGYNPSGTVKSRVYLQETVARNVMSFRGVKRGMNSTIGIPYGGTRHSKVDDQRDIMLIVNLLLKEGVGKFSMGRWSTGTKSSPVEIKESLDAYGEGLAELWTGRPLAASILKRTRGDKVWREDVGSTEVFVDNGAFGGDIEGDS
ncbi:hypothetical protein BDZ91DRAFT_828583 [Kalaharituber pfeilii]|nr:hypothetical protein BDZ91DRAFT_828583 [Kalaharituber pfeilii]